MSESSFINLEERLDAICESIEQLRAEFEDGAKLCAGLLHDMHLKMERIEKWITTKVAFTNKKNPQNQEELTSPLITDVEKKTLKKPLNPWKSP